MINLIYMWIEAAVYLVSAFCHLQLLGLYLINN